MDDRPTALIVHPGARDRLNLEHPEVGEHVRAILLEDDAPTDRPNAILERLAGDPRARAVDGVFGSSDASAHLAAHLASQLGLPGPTPEAFMRCHDKLESRRLQQRRGPGRHAAVLRARSERPDPGSLAASVPVVREARLGPPVAARVPRARPGSARSRDAVGPRSSSTVSRPSTRSSKERSFHLMLVEELLEGRLVTFEGSMCNGTMTPIGVTDSVMHPNGISFVRFDYPSDAPPRRGRTSG